MKLTEFFASVYKTNPGKAVAQLSDDAFVREMGWERVFHEGVGDGIYSPSENLVAVYDEDDLDTYSEYVFYRYNSDAWVSMEELFNGTRNGEEFEVEVWHDSCI